MAALAGQTANGADVVQKAKPCAAHRTHKPTELGMKARELVEQLMRFDLERRVGFKVKTTNGELSTSEIIEVQGVENCNGERCGL